MNKDKWIWMPHAGHFICGHRCQFRLNTYVNGYVISTVGELPDMLEKDGRFSEIGRNRLYETMVFRAAESGYACCPYDAIISEEKDFKGYMTADDAYKGHLELCEKYDKKPNGILEEG